MLKKTDPNLTPAIVMKPLAELYLAKEAPKGIDLTIRDSSSGSPLTDAELKASIYTNGIIHPLIWKMHAGKCYVVAGNRRLKALREIFAGAEGSHLAQHIQTQNIEDFEGDWRQIAMDTNLSLPPHLVERYELIVKLTKDLKLSPTDARLRFGMTDRQFDQVMALGKMSETVREAWRSGEIDAKTAQAFTLESDPKEQDRIFAAVKKNAFRGRVDAGDVKRKIIPANQQSTGKLAAFVGTEALEKAKLIKQKNFFEDQHIVTDVKALNKLAAEKIDVRCKNLIADGWAWALPEDNLEGSSWSYGTVEPSKKMEATPEERKRVEELQVIADDEAADEIERIEQQIKERGYGPEQRKKSGCILKISNSGELVIEYGRIKPGERKASSGERKKAKAKKPSTDGSPVLTNALVERLSEQLQIAGAEALKADHAVATSALIAAISSGGHALDIHVGHLSYDPKRKSSFSEVFAGAMKATSEQREAMFAQIAAQALSIIVHNAVGKMPLDDEGIADLFEAMNGTRVTDAIVRAFDAKDYFASVSMPAIVDAVKCSMGADHAAKVAKMKKPDAAKFAAANVPGKGWLPALLRTEHYTGPIEIEAAKKVKKPKPVKKVPAKKKRK